MISRLLDGDIFRLDSGREVRLEECCIARSGLGWIEGSKDLIRADLIETLPSRIRKKFPGDYYGLLVKPIPEGDLPLYTFMVSLHCQEIVGVDPESDFSSLIVCWLGNTIETNLYELIAREIRSVDWDKFAVNGAI